MFRLLLALSLGLMTALAGPLVAQDLRTLGFGRLFSNDFFGDGHDRWRTGSYQWSLIRGPGWNGARPATLGEIVEYRFRSDIIAPGRVTRGTVDRPYVGALSFGVHSHAALGAVDISLGADVVALGPQTGLAEAQDWYHDLLGLPQVNGTDSQIADAFRLAGTAEAALPLHLSDRVLVRPFAEAQAGVEDTVRIGADVVLGRVGQADLLTRDATTGHLIRAVEGPATGLAVTAGLDWGIVGNTLYLPEDEGFSALDDRWRARAGVHWQMAPRTSFFYGVTWLSEEFEGQPEGQLLGSLKLNFNF